MRRTTMGTAVAVLGLLAHGCNGEVESEDRTMRKAVCEGGPAPVEFPVVATPPPTMRSVAAMDRVAARGAPSILPSTPPVPDEPDEPGDPGYPPDDPGDPGDPSDPGAPMSVEARLLLLAGDGNEPELGAIQAVLDYRGTPYDVFIAGDEPPLTADRLWSGSHGHYQGTILANSSLWVGSGSALAAEEWAVLADYEHRFHIRRASLNTWPDPAYGFGPATPIDTTTASLSARCSAAGRGVFRDVNCDEAHPIRYAYTYLAAAQPGSPLVPLLTDDAGHALAAIHTGADGRESLLLLFANNQYLPHSLTFLHGVLGWVSGGTYLGDRRIDISAQVDDIFLGSDLWGGGEYRMDDADVTATVAWQEQHRASGAAPDFRLAMAFNGDGAAVGDPLTDALADHSAQWHWISHTLTHRVLDAVAHNVAYFELDQNRLVARSLGLANFDEQSVVTPRVSGLINPAAMEAALDVGIRYAVTDSSRPGCDNPTPNTAFYNQLSPQILLMPRRPTNLFYNVSTPAEWTGEYNQIYRSYWGRDLSYEEVLDRESDVLLVYLLRGETDPWMFHQANLRAYDGTHSLLSDLIDAALAKLGSRLRVPVRTPAMQATGRRFAARMQYEAAGVRGTIFPGRALILTAGVDTPVAVTGVRAADGESYGGDHVAVVSAIEGRTCIPLDAAGQGCNPEPDGGVGAGEVEALPALTCNASAEGT